MSRRNVVGAPYEVYVPPRLDPKKSHPLLLSIPAGDRRRLAKRFPAMRQPPEPLDRAATAAGLRAETKLRLDRWRLIAAEMPETEAGREAAKRIATLENLVVAEGTPP